MKRYIIKYRVGPRHLAEIAIHAHDSHEACWAARQQLGEIDIVNVQEDT